MNNHAAAYLDALSEEATPPPWRHLPGILKDYLESEASADGLYADFRFSVQSLHPIDGRDVPSDANCRLVATMRNATKLIAELMEASAAVLQSAIVSDATLADGTQLYYVPMPVIDALHQAQVLVENVVLASRISTDLELPQEE